MQASRRSSLPSSTVTTTRKTSTTASPNTKPKSTSQKHPSTASSADAAQTTPSVSSSQQTTSSSNAMSTPLVLSPISQLPKSTRRNSRAEMMSSDKPSSWDPEHFNPDGSLRTIHRMPGFEQAYAQAQKARYIRHSNPTEKEKELSVNQIFDKS